MSDAKTRRAARPVRLAARASRSQRARSQPDDLEPYWWRGDGA